MPYLTTKPEEWEAPMLDYSTDNPTGTVAAAALACLGAVVAITKGSLYFGPWEQIFYGEFDGRRRNACR